MYVVPDGPTSAGTSVEITLTTRHSFSHEQRPTLDILAVYYPLHVAYRDWADDGMVFYPHNSILCRLFFRPNTRTPFPILFSPIWKYLWTCRHGT